MQAKVPQGVTPYSGFTNAAVRIIAEEGFGGLWKGGGARCLRSPPQFAITSFVFEWLKSFDDPERSKTHISHPIDHGGLKHTTNYAIGKVDDIFGTKIPKFD